MKNNPSISPAAHEKIYADLTEKLANADLPTLAVRKDLNPCADGKIEIPSLGERYLVGRGVVESAGGEPVAPKTGLAVVSYLLSAGTGEPSGEFVSLGRLGGFNVGRANHEERSLKGPLLQRFGDDVELLARAVPTLGGVEEEGSSPGQRSWRFDLFPKLPLRLIHHAADEDFPAEINVLFNSRALEFFGFECLGFLPGYFISALLGAAEQT